eukprot:COSAG06_NODE_3001_length_5977_cov_16.775264_4_plen_47_part_00
MLCCPRDTSYSYHYRALAFHWQLGFHAARGTCALLSSEFPIVLFCP